ncbi:Phosphoribosylamine--glycine ligase, partial [Pseudomonas savastanoi pv. glycinea]
MLRQCGLVRRLGRLRHTAYSRISVIEVFEMNVLIIGSGGREHALAWKVAQDPRVQKVFVAPGNAGTAIEAKCENVAIDVLALEQLADFAEKNVSLTIVGPEVPLVAGVVDLFRSRGLDCFGPTAGA